MILAFLLVFLFNTISVDQFEDPDSIIQEAIDILDEDDSLAESFALKAKLLYEKDRDDEGVAKSLMTLGYIYDERYQYIEASIYYLEALRFNPDQYNELSCHKNLGRIYKVLDRSREAEAHYNKALLLARTYSKSETAGVLYNLGNLFRKQGYCSEAGVHYLEALDIALNTEDEMRINKLYNVIGLCYKDIGELQKAREYFQRIITRNSSNKYIGKSHHNIAWTYLQEDNYELAIESYQRAMSFKSEKDQIITLIDLGLCYESIGETQEAISFWQQVESMNSKLTDPKRFVVFKHLANVFSNDLVQYRKYSRLYQNKLEKYHDQSERLKEMNDRYEFDQKVNDYQKERIKIEHHKEVRFWILTGLTIAALLSILLIRVIRRRKLENAKRKEFKALKSERFKEKGWL